LSKELIWTKTKLLDSLDCPTEFFERKFYSMVKFFFWRISLRRSKNLIIFRELTNPFPCIYQILSIPKIKMVLENFYQ